MKRIVIAVCSGLVALFLFWSAGIDLTVRGEQLFWSLFGTLSVALTVYLFPAGEETSFQDIDREAKKRRY